MFFRANREEEFMRLAYPHLSLVFNVAFRLTGNCYDAEDLTQETFTIAYQKIRQLREKEKCRAWLLTILRNLYLRGRSKKQPELLEVDESGDDYWLLLEKYSATPSHDELADEAILAEEVQKLLLDLPEKYRLPLVLYYSEEFSCQQIAETIDLTIGTVMSRLGRGRELLKKKMLRRQRQAVGSVIFPAFDAKSGKKRTG